MLQVRGLRVELEKSEVLKDITFTIMPGELLAITGPNGSGKTTLLRCIIGEIIPESGEIEKSKGLTTAFLPQELSIRNQPVMEFLISGLPDIFNIFKKMKQGKTDSITYADAVSEYNQLGGYKLENRIETLAYSFGYNENDLNRDMESFSKGQRQIWAIIRVFLSPAELLILDEPMNHLDIAMRVYLEKLILAEKKRKKSFLVVSHDRVFIDRVADRTLYIRGGKGGGNKKGESIIVNGGYSEILLHLEQDFQARLKHSEELNRKIKKLEKEAIQKKVWADRKEKEKIGGGDKGFIGARAARLAKKAKLAEKRREKLIEKLKEGKPYIEKRINLSFENYNVPRRGMVTAKDISKSYGENLIFKDVNINLNTNSRTAIIGPNGSGKTTIMKCLIGLEKADSGEVYRNENVNYIYIPQNIRNYFKKEILLDNLMIYNIEQYIVRQYLGAAKLRRDKVLQPVSTLSYGELMRSAIVSAILAKAEFLFMDEPTNHLDIESLEVLDDLLISFPGGMLFISHDRSFIAKNASQIYTISDKTLKQYSL